MILQDEGRLFFLFQNQDFEILHLNYLVLELKGHQAASADFFVDLDAKTESNINDIMLLSVYLKN